MANDLRKFVNPKFLKTIDLALLRRLFERQPPPPAAAAGRGFDLAVFDGGDDAAVRAALAAFFEGPEDELPPGLVADLHHIAELGTEHGMNLLLERARRRQVVIEVPLDAQGEPLPVDPKHFALLAFLDHRPVFDAASDMLAKELRSSFAEYVGRDEGVEPRLDIVARAAFEAAAAEMFRRDHRGAHCRVGWYEDGDQVNLIVTHGAPVSTVPVIEAGQERVISFRSLEHAVLSYHAGSGRLGVAGISKARRADLAEAFAAHLLGRPGFFAGEDCQDLYTLERIERTGLGFEVDHAFDPGILRVDIVEVALDRLGAPGRAGDPPVVEACHVTRDFGERPNALRRIGEHTDRVAFGPGRYRIGHAVFRVLFEARRGRRPASVTVKVKPPSIAAFKRQRYEARVMELLRRNRFCREREPAEAAVAAE